MSEEALIETIRAHLQVLRSEKRRFVAAVPGNMGERFLSAYLEQEGIGKIPAVVCSNFVGRTLDLAGELGSIEPGKAADVVIWESEPFKAGGRPRTVLINGKIQYQAES